ncbi:MAG: hypothetical protein GY779_15135 [Gammaproteobacteria bacterium]|nr:hypothetical protein [Gammaproteobacteria bacterium]
MVTKYLTLPITMVLIFSAYQAVAATDEQLNSIKRMGELNGVALHCEFLGETRRMKQALVTAMPKRRQLGQSFDDVTNTSFLSFIQAKSECPGEQQFIQEVTAAIAGLNQAFSKP